MKIKTIYILACLMMLLSCKDNTVSKMPTLDLLSHGIPIEIKAPADAEVSSNDLGVLKDVTVVSGEQFYIQIFSGQANTISVDEVKQDLLLDVKTSPYFSKIIEEYDDGFIFEKKIGDRINYDFRHIKIMGDNEYTFQTGLVGKYSEDDVRLMYEASKNEG